MECKWEFGECGTSPPTNHQATNAVTRQRFIPLILNFPIFNILFQLIKWTWTPAAHVTSSFDLACHRKNVTMEKALLQHAGS
jgi:hypothetical protein